MGDLYNKVAVNSSYSLEQSCDMGINYSYIDQDMTNKRHYRNKCLHSRSWYFKCPGYYCIPWRLVCNGLWDCPDGTEEEFLCNRTSCPGQFKCHNTSICISACSICDDVMDCKLGDDEHFCHPLLPACPENCTCIIFSICPSRGPDTQTSLLF